MVLKVTPSRRDESGVDQAFARFLQEYEIAQRVRHPNIVRLYELGVADDHAYLAMEYFQRGDLRRRMRGGISPSEALRLRLADRARAGRAARGGILHRDLKPGNVMLRADGQIALIDFGLAKHEALEYEITDTGLIFGTPHYMSPEQGHGQELDPRSDLYSLGVMLFEMLTGQKPYTADNPMAIIYMHRNAPMPRLPEPLADLQPLLDAHARQAARRIASPTPRRPCARSMQARASLAAKGALAVSLLRRADPGGLGRCRLRALARAAGRSRQLREEGRLERAGADLRLSGGSGAERARCRAWRARSCGTSSRSQQLMRAAAGVSFERQRPGALCGRTARGAASARAGHANST